MILFLVIFAIKSPHIYWVAVSVPPIVAIAFLLIQLRVALGLSSWYDGSQSTTGTASANSAFIASEGTGTHFSPNRSGHGAIGSGHPDKLRVRVLQESMDHALELDPLKPVYSSSKV
jgi:hypothetical protein